MKNIWIWILIVSAILTSCKSSEPEITIINGSVTDYYSGLKVSNAQVKLVSIFNPNNPRLEKFDPYNTDNVLFEASSDEYGDFSITAKDLPDSGCGLVIINDSIGSVEYYPIESGKRNNIELLVKNLTKFRINISNEMHEYDMLKITYYNDDKIIDYIFINELNVDTAITRRAFPETELELKVDLQKDGFHKLYMDTTIIVQKVDNMTFELRY